MQFSRSFGHTAEDILAWLGLNGGYNAEFLTIDRPNERMLLVEYSDWVIKGEGGSGTIYKLRHRDFVDIYESA